mgnify:CR=1 FL=1
MIQADEARKKAEENFLSGYNCAQSVMLVFCDELNIPKETALRMAQSFGGREMCGTVSGMLMLLGFLKGSTDPKDKAAKDELYRLGQQLVASFKEEHGSYICKELLGLVPMGTNKSFLTEEAVINKSGTVSDERTEEYYRKRPCPKLCGDSAAIFAEFLKGLSNDR